MPKEVDAQTMFFRAVKQGDLAAVKKLLAADKTLVKVREKDNSTPLHYAAWKGHPEIATVLLDHGAEIGAKNENGHWGTTPLHAAAHGNQRAVAEILIARGADVKAKDAAGNTPMHHTTIHNATAVAKLLKASGG